MAKRQKPPPMELELKQRLTQQDEAMESMRKEQDYKMETLNKAVQQVLELLKGSSMMNTPGLIKTFNGFEEKIEEATKRMAYFERWWELQKMKKGTFTFKTANLLTRGLSFLGGIGLLASIVYSVIQIVEHLKK